MDSVPETRLRSIEVETDREQDYFWAEEWQAGEREANREMEEGEGEILMTGDDFLRALDPERAERDRI